MKGRSVKKGNASGVKRGMEIGMAAQTKQEEVTQKGPMAKPPILGPRRQFEGEHFFHIP